jgi:hypothetical protein
MHARIRLRRITADFSAGIRLHYGQSAKYRCSNCEIEKSDRFIANLECHIFGMAYAVVFIAVASTKLISGGKRDTIRQLRPTKHAPGPA